MYFRTLFAATVLLASLLSSCSRSRPAPDFALRDQAGRQARLSEYRGKVVALNFWATWCPPCRYEIPWLDRLQRQYGSEGLVVLGISMDERGWQDIVPFLLNLKVGYRIVLGTQHLAQQYGVGPPPTTFLVDRQGRIAGVYAGVVNQKAFEARVKQLLQTAAPTGP